MRKYHGFIRKTENNKKEAESFLSPFINYIILLNINLVYTELLFLPDYNSQSKE